MDKMNIIYTYKWILGDNLQPKVGYTKGMNNRVVQIAKFSVEQANLFGTTIMYCDSKSYSVFNNLDIPFKKLIKCDELDNLNTHHWGLHKLLVMSLQKHPFIHIDLDTILLKKPNIHYGNDFTFGFKAWDLRNGDIIDGDEINYINDVYVSEFNRYHKNSKYEDMFFSDNIYNGLFNKNLDFGLSPSLCYIEVQNLNTLERAFNDTMLLSQPCLDVDNNNLNQYLEQFVFFTMAKKYSNTDFKFISDDFKFKRFDNLNGMDTGLIGNIDYLKDIPFVHLPLLHTFSNKVVNKIINDIKKITTQLI